MKKDSCKKSTYDYVKDFNQDYPGSVCWWRCKKHSAIIDMHLNPGEYVVFAFAAQKNDNPFDLFFTQVFALTNKRILMARKRIFFGYLLTSVTPDLFNDLKVARGIFWGKVIVDTVKEVIVFSNISISGLNTIETQVTDFMIKEKKKYDRAKTC